MPRTARQFIDSRGQLEPWPSYRQAGNSPGDMGPSTLLTAAEQWATEKGFGGAAHLFRLTYLLLEPGGAGQVMGMAVGGSLGAEFGRRMLGYPGAVVGGAIFGTAGGWFGSLWDDAFGNGW